ncbi:pentapeptide repeat-containing protein [Nonomuraea wenchangensis]
MLQDLGKLPLAERVSARIEAGRTALAAAAGVGAAVTLLLAVRRQRHQELATAHTTHDATERRVTELYTKAVEQLGSDQAPVRLGGLYALERLGEHTPALQQTIVDVVCAYLRMPYTPPPDETSPDEPAVPRAAVAGVSTTRGRDPHEERQVRLTAQRLLAAHLRYELPRRRHWRQRRPSPDPRHWPGINLDLTGATLIDLDLRQCRFNTVQFGKATFTGSTRFNDTAFTGNAQFGEATFTGNAEFSEATFTGNAEFSGATFAGIVQFRRVTFTRDVWFTRATFTRRALFTRAAFTCRVLFIGTIFALRAEFSGATFAGNAQFRSAKFTRDAQFTKATFTRDVSFTRAAFTRRALFNEATFAGNARFNRATGLEKAHLHDVRVAPAAEGIRREWPSSWRVVQTAGGWQTLQLAILCEEGQATSGMPSPKVEGP